MAKYRTKRCVIEAVQFHPDHHSKSLPEGVVVIKHSPNADNYYYDGFEFGINTPEGVMEVNWYDWIITGLVGEKYACKPEPFALKYELDEGPTLESILRELVDAGEKARSVIDKMMGDSDLTNGDNSPEFAAMVALSQAIDKARKELGEGGGK